MNRAFIVLSVFLLACVGLLIWSVQHNQAKAAKLEATILKELSAEDVATLLETQYGQQPGALQQIAGSVEARENLLEKQYKPLLALAGEARRTGLAEDPEVKNQLELAELELLALAYDQKLRKDAGKENDPTPPFGFVEQTIKQEEIDAFWKEPESETKFANLVKMLEESNPAKTKIPEAQLGQIREQWAKVTLAARRAKELGLENQRETRLQIAFQQARTLAQAYGTRHQKELEVSKEEAAQFVKENPQFDGSSKRAKAEEVLQRAKAGEDFAKLANEFSEDPGNRDQGSGTQKGGLYENIEKGMFMPNFENAALALEPGQIADGLVETPYGYHIIKLESKGATKDKDGKEKETYNVRHILISTMYQDPSNPFSRPVPFEQAAQQAAQQKKVEKFIAEIVARNQVSLPKAEEIKLEVPESAGNPMMQGLPPEMPAGSDGHDHGAEPNSKEPAKPKKK